MNRVSSGYIRTEADELQYNLHIMLRYELERALVSGDLSVGNLEDAWNTRFLTYFGFPIDRAANGILQDVHWSQGLFGYFPAYTLGNVYAACLYEKMSIDIPTLQKDLEKGDTSKGTRWLKEMLQQHGCRYSAQDLVTGACGKAPSVLPLVDYMNSKFTDLYGL